MSQFGTILAESQITRDALKAANPHLGTVLPDVAVIEAQLLALVKVLGDASAINLDDYITELRAIISRFQVSSGVDLETAMHAALPPSVVTQMTTRCPVTAVVGYPFVVVVTLYDAASNPVPSCSDSIRFVDYDDPGTQVPATGPANTDANGEAPYQIVFTAYKGGVHRLFATDVDVPVWAPDAGGEVGGLFIVASVQAAVPATATAGVPITITIGIYDDVGAFSQNGAEFGLMVSSSDAGALVNFNGGSFHAVPHDYMSELVAASGAAETYRTIKFSAPGTYTVTLAFQTAAGGGSGQYNLTIPNQVFTVVVS